MKSITQSNTTREFLGKCKSYYVNIRKSGYSKNEISFLNLVEYIGPASNMFTKCCERFFKCGPGCYCWCDGNEEFKRYINEWESQFLNNKAK